MADNFGLAEENQLDAWFDAMDGRRWESLREIEAAVCMAKMFDDQVQNGGFHQALLNIGNYWESISDAFKRLGDGRRGRMCEEALTVFPNGRPALDQAIRSQQMSSLDESALDFLWRLGGEYYDLNAMPDEDLRAKMYAALKRENSL